MITLLAGMVESRPFRPPHRPKMLLLMQELPAQVSRPADINRAPLHDEIAQRARDLWSQYGQPADRDLAIWLEAEQQLHSGTPTSPEPDCAPPPQVELPPAQPPVAAPRRRSRR